MINNYNEFKEYLKKLDTKPKLLLHACCGPCSTHTLKVLEKYFDITIYFDNSNMDTEEEFLKRLAAQKTVIESFKDIKLVVGKYLPETFYDAIKGDEHLGEFSSRCTKCMNLRLENTAIYAKESGYDLFSTTLSISPYKNSNIINELGYHLADKYQIEYLYSNFKKEEGYKNSIKISKELNLYRQDYCGCIYSKKEHEAKIDGSKN